MFFRYHSIGFYLFLLFCLLAAASCGAPEPTPTTVVQAPTLAPTFAPTALPTATRTPTLTPTLTPSPLPTDTAIPTPTSTPSQTPTPTSTPLPPTNTPTNTSTATPTPEPPTDTPTVAPPTATPKPPPPIVTPKPEDNFSFDITMQRMLQIDENGGVVGDHNIYIHAFDANGNPLNGVVVCRVYALQMQPPDPHACRITGEKGPGRTHFDVFAGDIVYVASVDPEHRPLSAHTRPLEQEPAAMTDLQELVDNGYCESVEDCQRRIPINNLVRFHYSYEVHFKRRW